MGLLAAATYARDSYEVVLIDQRVDQGWRSKLDDALAARPLAVGITAMTGPTLRHAVEMVRHVRGRSETPVFWGGTHVTLRPEQSIESGLADYLVMGEGEVAFKAALDRLASGKDVEGIPGVWSPSVRNPRAEPLDFSSVPLAPYDLVDFSRYLYSHRGMRTLDYLSSRGCPHRCTYCYNNVFYQSRWSAKDAPQVEQELLSLRARYDFDALYFLDDNFFIDVRRADRVVEVMRRLAIPFEIQGVDIQTIARMSDQQLSHLEASGLTKITIGVESASDRIRRKIGKWGKSDAVLPALKRLAGRRFLVLTSFIIGFPGETPEEMDRTIAFALDLQKLGDNFRLPQFYAYTPIPGTTLGDEALSPNPDSPSPVERSEPGEVAAPSGRRGPSCGDTPSTTDLAAVDWDHYWLAGADVAARTRLEAIAFLSKFIDRKHQDYGAKWFVSLLYEMYRPVALARLRLKRYGLLVEKPAYEVLKRFV